MQRVINTKILLLLLMAGIGFPFLATGCSDDNDEDDDGLGISLEFNLLNSEDKRTEAFIEGSDICFNLTLRNNSDKDVVLRINDLFDIPYYFKAKDVIDENESNPYRNIFAVYSSDGKYVGCAWSELCIEDVKIKAGQMLSLRSNWLYTKRRDPLVFINTRENGLLSTGNYYAITKARYGDGPLTTFRVDFTVNRSH